MKKSHYVTALFVLISNVLLAQIGGIENSVNDVSNTIRAIFPHHIRSHFFNRISF